MRVALQLIATLALLVGAAASILWLVEAVAKRIGSRNTWLLVLVAIPFTISLVATALTWETLGWWERLAYPLSGPVVALILLFAGFAAVNPADALLLPCTIARLGWRSLMRRAAGRKRDA